MLSSSSCIWAISSVFIVSVQLVYVTWTILWMLLDIISLFSLRITKKFFIYLYTIIFSNSSYIFYKNLLTSLHQTKTYKEWLLIATSLDELRGSTLWRKDNYSNDYDVNLIEQSYTILKEYRNKIFFKEYMTTTTPSVGSSSSSTTSTTTTTNIMDPLDSLFFHLTPMVSRNFGGIENSSIYQYSLLGTKFLIEKFLKEINRCLQLLISTLPNKQILQEPCIPLENTSISNVTVSNLLPLYHILHQRIEYIDKLRLQLGRTSLALSGGGAFSLAHLGVVRTLLEHGLLPKVISGTSGGSLIAALMAIHSDEILINHILIPEIIYYDHYNYHVWGKVPLSSLSPTSSPSALDTQRTNISTSTPFFDTFPTQFYRFLTTSFTGNYPYFMDPQQFMNNLSIYLQDFTFEEAFYRTGRIINIPVVASITNTPISTTVIHPSMSTAYQHQHTFVLNYLTAPHVLLRSAVAASCALPGLLPPVTLLAKNKHGQIINFHTIGIQTIDGSMQMDIPFQEMSMLFHVRNVIVSQCNPHITIFLSASKHESYILPQYTVESSSPLSDTINPTSSIDNNNPPSRSVHQNQSSMVPLTSHYPRTLIKGKDSLLYRSIHLIEDWLQQDILTRLKNLAYLRLLPKWFGGWDMYGIILQKYTGNITIIPRQSFLSLWKAFKQPTVHDMEHYILQGTRATWPHLAHIRSMISIEKKLAECSRTLNQYQDHITKLLHTSPSMITNTTESGKEEALVDTSQPPISTSKPTISEAITPISKLTSSTPSILTQYSYSNKKPPFPIIFPSSSSFLVPSSTLPIEVNPAIINTIPSTVEPMRVISYSIPKNLSGGMEAYFNNPPNEYSNTDTTENDDTDTEQFPTVNNDNLFTIDNLVPSLVNTTNTISPTIPVTPISAVSIPALTRSMTPRTLPRTHSRSDILLSSSKSPQEI